jgi:hypothetical protein
MWIHILGEIAAYAIAHPCHPMWVIPNLFVGQSPKQRERSLFKNEISHARVKLARRERALARAAVAARSARLDTRETRVSRAQTAVAVARDKLAARDAARAETARVEREKRARLAAQRVAMNSGASAHGTRLAQSNYYTAIKR